MKKIVFLLILLIINIKLYSQKVEKHIVFADTVKLSGILIFDNKKQVIIVKEGVFSNDILDKSKLQRIVNSADHIFLEPYTVKKIFRQEKGVLIEFCNNENSEYFAFHDKPLLYKRYYAIPFKDVLFVNLINDEKKYITFKCW